MFGLIQEYLIAHPLIELSLILSVLVCSGYIATRLNQPVLVGYIFGGLLLSPQALDFINHQEQIEIYAHFGVSILLFMVGLGLNPHIIRELGKVSLVAGVGQVVFTSLVGYGLTYLLGYDPMTSLYLAIALTFSSTIVIVKLITDRGDTATVYGQIALGILIVQDIIAMLILITISASMTENIYGSTVMFIGMIFLKLLGLGLFTWLMTKFALKPILHKLASTKELPLLFAIAWALVLGSLWYFAGFSMEIGALLAGMSLASSHYRYHIFSELRPMRDFFIALFFVYLGSQTIFENLGLHTLTIVILSLFVLIGNPTIVYLIMNRLNYTRRTSFMTGLTVAQISEFSFIVIGLAITAGHIQNSYVLSMVTLIGLITMTGSSYLFKYADYIYHKLEHRLPKLNTDETEVLHSDHVNFDILILGFGSVGNYLAKKYRDAHLKVCIIDHNPKEIERAKKLGYTARYGDINDEDTLEDLLHPKITCVCSTIDDYDTSMHIIRLIDDYQHNLPLVCLAMYLEEAEDYYSHGASYVILPHMSGAQHSWSILEQHIWNPDIFITHQISERKFMSDYKSGE